MKKSKARSLLCCGLLVFSFLLSSFLCGCGGGKIACDFILKGGTVIDGTGAASYVADVAVKDGKIVKIGETLNADADATVYDVTGQIVSPGFIDVHTHSDSAPFSQFSVVSKIFQGVTTEICGNCGKSPLPYSEQAYEEYLKTPSGEKDALKTARLSMENYANTVNEKGYYNNLGMLIGHARLRTSVIGEEDREPTSEELEEMKSLLDTAMTQGAFGMSLGLTYPPSAFGKKPELVELAKVVAKHNGIMSVHMRNEGHQVVEAVQEVLDIAKESGVRLQISHLKILSASNWGKSGELLKMVEDARNEGIDVRCDQYPFTASSTGLKVLLPDWAQDGGKEAILKNIAEPTEQLKQDIEDRIAERGGAEKILILVLGKKGTEHNNKYLSEIMEETGLGAADATIKVLADTSVGATGIYFSMDENDVYNIMSSDFVCVGSDGSAYGLADETLPHPRNFATYPQFFQTVREKNLFPIEKAVWKCTGLPAEIMGITDRGILKEGNQADIVVFSQENIKSNSTYVDSRKAPDGISLIFVNGVLTVKDNKIQEKDAGRVLLKTK